MVVAVEVVRFLATARADLDKADAEAAALALSAAV